MLQDELARLTLTELDKRDERQDVERVCECQLEGARLLLPLHGFLHRVEIGYHLEHLK